jgi:hypothetical protein
MNRPTVHAPESEPIITARAWAALACWTAARSALHTGVLAAFLAITAPWWAGVSRPDALGTAVVALAAALVARDLCLAAGDALAPQACSESADLHYVEYEPAPVPCACGRSATPDDTLACRTTAPTA